MTLQTITFDDSEWVLVPREMSAQHLIRLANNEKHLAVLDKPKWHRDIYKAMLSAAPKPEAKDGWLPIESAPEEGWFLATNGKLLDTLRRYSDRFAGSKFGLSSPTHWFPLPQPPKQG